MKKIYSAILSLLLLTVFGSQAQERKYCHTDEVYSETVKQHPEIIERGKQQEEFISNFIRNNPQARHTTGANGTTSTVYIIPVVFHVIHEYGPENISDAQIIDAVRILNRDYRKQNADTANITPDFQALAADVEIEFRLAKIDPNGNCTNGIERIVSFRTQVGDDVAKLNPWPNYQYLNIWTVAKFSSAHASAAAYAYRPANVPNPTVDGVISLADYVGSIGTSNVTNSRTLTHEIGHCLDLRHPWGGEAVGGNPPIPVGTVCGDDGVGDTPVTKGWSGPPCPSPPYDICNAGINENFQNYMDYSYCDCMFTYGQKTRMVAALNSATSFRSSLWTPGNLAATGTDGSPQPLCVPVADFYTNQDHICSGDSTQFFSNSYNSDTINCLWSFPSGAPSSSTLKNPYVNYPAPGTYNVTLTASNSSGNNAITKNSYITVSGSPTITPNYLEDFETAGTFPGTGYILNNVGNAWQRITTNGFQSTACLRFLNYNTSQSGFVDSWITPSINTLGYNSSLLTFRMAYALSNANPSASDVLKIYISTNCGKTWGTARRTITGSQLATTTNVGAGFTPTSAAQWALITVANVSPMNNKPNVRLKFEFTSDGGNNIFIDDINITANPTGIVPVEPEDIVNFDVFPNPSHDEITLAFDMPESGHAEVKITDIIGREIKTVVKEQLVSGAYEYKVNARDFNRGIYLVTLKTAQAMTIKKLLID